MLVIIHLYQIILISKLKFIKFILHICVNFGFVLKIITKYL